MKNYIEFQDYINMLAADFKDSGYEDCTDYAHEAADGSEYVIYYGKAWGLIDTVRSYNSGLYFDGESWALGLGEKQESLDSMITSIAYGIIYTALVNKILHNALTEEAA